ncbi:MAG: DMT family transporter [Spirochaetales bacterium]|nr:DMT family transporter [Spirochaetales bacterium]
MKKSVLTNDLLLLLTSLIWGSAFVAQRVGMDYIGPFTYNAARFYIGPLSLIPLIAIRWKKIPPEHKKIKPYLLNGLIAGSVVFTASTLQQMGLVHTTAGNAGFITGFYVVLVPILSFFLGQPIGLIRWAAAVLALGGLYFLSVSQGFVIGRGDGLVLSSALFWALHIIVIDHGTARLDSLIFSFTQFLLCAIFSTVGAFLFETPTWSGIGEGIGPILYGGILSVGVAYTLQVVAQKSVPPSHAVIILSMEGAFAALSGALFLGEVLTLRQLLGCLLMLAGMVISQLARRNH